MEGCYNRNRTQKQGRGMKRQMSSGWLSEPAASGLVSVLGGCSVWPSCASNLSILRALWVQPTHVVLFTCVPRCLGSMARVSSQILL